MADASIAKGLDTKSEAISERRIRTLPHCNGRRHEPELLDIRFLNHSIPICWT